MEWVEGRITKRSVDAAKAPETRDAITEELIPEPISWNFPLRAIKFSN
jgi:hypothetical protein